MKKNKTEQELLASLSEKIKHELTIHKIPYTFMYAGADLDTKTAKNMMNGKNVKSGNLLMALQVIGYEFVLKKLRGNPLNNQEYIEKYNNRKKYNSDAKRKSVERLTGKSVATRVSKKPKRRKKPKARKRYVEPVRIISQREAVNNYTKEQDDIFGTP